MQWRQNYESKKTSHRWLLANDYRLRLTTRFEPPLPGAHSDEIGSHWHSTSDLHPDQRFERLDRSRTRIRNGMKQFPHRLRTANKFHRALCAEGRRSRQNHHVPAGSYTRHQSDQRIVFRQRDVRWAGKVAGGLSRLWMLADDRKITLPRTRCYPLENEILRARNVEQRKIL